MPQPPDEQSDLVTVSDDEGQIQSPTSSVKSDKGQSESDDVINNSVQTTEIEQETESIEMDKEAGNEYENKSNHIGSADEEDIDDEIQELPQDESLTERLKNGASDDDLEEGGGSEDEDDEPEEGVNSSVTSSLMATEVLDNSVDSIIEDEGDDMEGSSIVTGKDRNTRNKRPVVDDEVMEIVEEDPLGAEEGSGIDDEDDIDETAVLSDEEDRDDDGDQERINNSRSPIPNSTSEFDNSRDSSVEELGVGNSVEEGDSCEEILDDDDDSEAIVVNDTKSLAQLAASATIANSSNSTIININTPPTTRKEQSKEPTLVIIDTNSILSGKGPIPIQKPTVTSTISNNSLQSLATSNSTTPKSNSTKDILLAPAPPKAGATINIPDDAFLIEAPSFIVPYVFEQSGQKVLKSYVKEIADEIKKEKAAADGVDEDIEEVTPKKKSEDYFESPVGKLLINLGMSLVQEYVQVDLLKLQRRKAEKERAKSRSGVPNIQTQQSIISLKNNIEESKENNEPFRHPLLKCKNCNFKTESELVMSTHLETPHMKNNCYRCNFCKHTTKLPNEILLHMEQDHKIRPRLERAPAVHQCPHCTFEDNSKAKLTRHLVSCTKRFRMDKNLEPPQDWDTPGKLPKMPKNRLVQQGAYNPGSGYVGGNTQQQQSQRSLLAQYPTMSSMANKYIQQGNRMQLPPLLQAPKVKPLPGLIRTNPGMLNPVNKLNQQTMPRGMIMRTASGQQVLTQPQIVGGQVIHQVIGNQLQMAGNSNAPKFLSNLGMAAGASNTSQRSASQLVSRNQGKNSQPSISITPLPRQSSIPAPAIASHSKPQGKASFVICEICDGYIKDLDQLRNHMQWIHKVKIHPKMIYNKPPLNCQKCQFRFFTDQGLERHLLGSHGLVTSSMQEAANKGQDNGRCPLCGKVYQWKLLAHVAKDHNVTLKPAHLSYKCTVCTATFGMYKLFESHVYSAHSMNSKRANSNNNSGRPLPSGSNNANNNRGQMQVTSRAVAPGGAGGNSFKPLKINDEITIIPQPLANATPLRTKGSLTITPHNANNARRSGRTNGDDGIEIIEIDEASNGRTSKENGEYRSLTESTSLRKRNLDISVCGTDSDNSDDSYQRAPTPAKRLRGN